MTIIPKLKKNSFYDQADEIFFVFEGSALIYTDLSDIVDMRDLIKPDGAFNVPITVYQKGSLFGDADISGDGIKNRYRKLSAFC
jgi:CRP-like cAMP-binding protein